MNAVRINGLKVNVHRLTDRELETMLTQAADRVAAAQRDIETLKQVQASRGQLRLVK